MHSQAACSDCQPITVGIPFAKGVLRNYQALALFDQTGQRRPVQTLPLAHWSDGSVKWLLVDYVLPAVVPDQAPWLLKSCPGALATEAELKVTEKLQGVIIETAMAAFQIGLDGLPFRRVVMDGREIIDADSSHIILQDGRGKMWRSGAGS